MQVPRPLLAARSLVDSAARHSPARLAVTVFAGVIGVFTALLLLPQATADGTGASVADALFTATSAVCITGLTTVDTATYWSTWGQVVILVGIKVGGLGVMTLASLLGMAVSRRIGLTQRLLTASETKISRLGEVGALLQVIVVTSTALELAIAAALFPRFLVLRETIGEAAWHAIFYGVSAFNNAGFVPTAGGLVEHPSDWWLGAPILLGVAIGSLGFPVILDIWRTGKAYSHWSLHTKLTLATSAVLTVGGAVIIGLFEWNREETFGRLDTSGKFLGALMAGVMPRSGGFATVETGAMHEASWLFTDALMFVGGGSASTAGGIKVTTLAVMVLAIIAEARGDRDVEAFGRRIPRESLRLAVAVAFVGATIVLVSSLALLELTGEKLDHVLFEVISAFATVGLSTGMALPESAKYLLSALMFVGRTGTMTVAAALALRDRRRVIRYPEERPILG
ncbi:TrkH family potassium uptake protein [Actinotalea sp.]|uniref:TrkH family potassium uptake protein n=1 Tax=Actinotalea sp. TaxID=1872145 RepID=UPI00356A10FD